MMVFLVLNLNAPTQFAKIEEEVMNEKRKERKRCK
jgi:hypothetical protein